MYDVIIIGAGPAGISASIYAKRAGLDVVVFDTNNSALKKAKNLENFYSYEAISGIDLVEKGIKHAKNLEIEIKTEEVLNIKMHYQTNPTFTVTTSNSTFDGKTIILATGALRAFPSVANLKDYSNKNISFCATCDGFFYREKTVGVLGYTEYAKEEASYLKNIAKDVIIFTNEKPLEFDASNFKTETSKITSFEGEMLEEVITKDSKTKIDGLFIAWGSPGGFEFAKKLGLEIKDGHLCVNEKMQTNIKGIYAIGDITGKPYQIAKAVYEGMIASMSIIDLIK